MGESDFRPAMCEDQKKFARVGRLFQLSSPRQGARALACKMQIHAKRAVNQNPSNSGSNGSAGSSAYISHCEVRGRNAGTSASIRPQLHTGRGFEPAQGPAASEDLGSGRRSHQTLRLSGTKVQARGSDTLSAPDALVPVFTRAVNMIQAGTCKTAN